MLAPQLCLSGPCEAGSALCLCWIRVHQPSCLSESFVNEKKSDPLSSDSSLHLYKGTAAWCALQSWSQNSGHRGRRVYDQIRLENAVGFVSLLDIPSGHEQINSSGDPGVEKSVKKCHFTQHPPTVFDHRILFSISNPLRQVVLKNIPCNE